MEVLGAALFALTGAALIVLLLARWSLLLSTARVVEGSRTAEFLFEGDRLVEVTPAGRSLLRGSRRGGSDLPSVLESLRPLFGSEVAQRIAALPRSGRFLVGAPSGEGTLEAQEEEGALRLTLRLGESDEIQLDRLRLEDARNEAALLRGIAEDLPTAIWGLDTSGTLVWANRAYLSLADQVRAAGRPELAGRARETWPTAPIFETPAALSHGEVRENRRPLRLADHEHDSWFEVTSLGRGTGTLHVAAPVARS